MVAMRKIGNVIEKLANDKKINRESLAKLIDCDPSDIPALFKGFVYPSFTQLQVMADEFSVDVQDILDGDDQYYESNFVHCMTTFKNPDNREKILDLIYAYIDIRDAALK